MSVQIRVDRSSLEPRALNHRHVSLHLRAPELPAVTPSSAMAVTFVIDRSSSMAGDRIRLAKRAVLEALELLRPQDQFAVVFYDGETDVAVPLNLASPEQLREAKHQLSWYRARGATELSSGWLRGCEQLSGPAGDGLPSRVFLLTDGKANRGITDIRELGAHAAALREMGIVTTTFGLGESFEEELLLELSAQGGGNAYYLEEPEQIGPFMKSEVRESIEASVRDARLLLRLPESVEIDSLTTYPSTRTAEGLEVRLGDLVSGQELTLGFRLELDTRHTHEPLELVGELRAGPSDALEHERAAVGFRMLDASDQVHDDLDTEVAIEVASLVAARARLHALRLHRGRQLRESAFTLETAAKSILTWFDRHPAIKDIALELHEDAAHYLKKMSERERKRRTFVSFSSSRSRHADGTAVRHRS